VDAGDYVIVSDALKVHLTGKKGSEKTYFHHSGYMSGLKEVPISRMRERRPEDVSLCKLQDHFLPRKTRCSALAS